MHKKDVPLPQKKKKKSNVGIMILAISFYGT